MITQYKKCKDILSINKNDTLSGVALYFIILYGKYVRYPIGVLKNTDVTLIPVSGEPA